VRFVAVAEPDSGRRERAGAAHGIPPERRFAHWPELLAADVDIDAVVIATPDREHVEPAVAAARAGQLVLLEKPIAPEAANVARLAAAAASAPGEIVVAHPLRYTPFFGAIEELVRGGSIGRLIGIEHLENVSSWHFAHSYVRGNWRRRDLASPLILSKACHDLDVVRWLAGARCVSVASVGRLNHFRVEEAPAGAPAFCLDGCPVADACPFYAPRFYLPQLAEGGWPVSVVTTARDEEGLLAALATGPYGRCVYRSDNDVADHQSTLLEFVNGVTATLTVSAFTAENARTLKLFGTEGELRGHMEKGDIEVRRFRDGHGREVPAPRRTTPETGGGHGGGDDRMMAAFVERARRRRDGEPVDEPATSLAVSIESHLMAFAAEESRASGATIGLGAAGGTGG
jgi:predicted dehydrogenase